jgi:ABC-type transport system involved in cytochrome bd biosynthesis fused ATPase/permease subunit
VGELFAGIPPEFFTGGGAVGIALIAVLMVLTGRLVPRRTHEETRADRDEWRKAFQDSEAARQVQATAQRVQADQLDQLLESARATEKVMTAIRETVTRLEGGR